MGEPTARVAALGGMVIAANSPGFYETQEAALTGTGGGMLLEDYIRLRRTQA